MDCKRLPISFMRFSIDSADSPAARAYHRISYFRLASNTGDKSSSAFSMSLAATLSPNASRRLGISPRIVSTTLISLLTWVVKISLSTVRAPCRQPINRLIETAGWAQDVSAQQFSIWVYHGCLLRWCHFNIDIDRATSHTTPTPTIQSKGLLEHANYNILRVLYLCLGCEIGRLGLLPAIRAECDPYACLDERIPRPVVNHRAVRLSLIQAAPFRRFLAYK